MRHLKTHSDGPAPGAEPERAIRVAVSPILVIPQHCCPLIGEAASEVRHYGAEGVPPTDPQCTKRSRGGVPRVETGLVSLIFPPSTRAVDVGPRVIGLDAENVVRALPVGANRYSGEPSLRADVRCNHEAAGRNRIRRG